MPLLDLIRRELDQRQIQFWMRTPLDKMSDAELLALRSYLLREKPDFAEEQEPTAPKPKG
jgi:hypothetical protein